MRAIRVLGCVAAIVFWTPHCFAEGAKDADRDASADSSAADEIFSSFGYTTAKGSKFDADHCAVAFDLNQQKFVEAIPRLQKIGLLNPDLTQTKINMMPNSIALAFMSEILPLQVRSVYENHKNVDRCQFTQFQTLIDDYGNDKTSIAATFGFDRATFSRVNWDKFNDSSFPKISKEFHWSANMMRSIMSERE